jgi:hypothetical protein
MRRPWHQLEGRTAELEGTSSYLGRRWLTRQGDGDEGLGTRSTAWSVGVGRGFLAISKAVRCW